MTRLPLAQLIERKPRPETTLSLLRSFQDQPQEMVEAYVFTDAIRHHFTKILEAVAIAKGQGFWVQAEYGAGKTHFLAALAALLANQSEGLWALVQDEQVRNYQRRLQGTRLFPVILSLRGMGDADATTSRNLLTVLLEEGFQKAMERAELADAVSVVAAEDYITWFEQQTADAVRSDIEASIRRKTGLSPQAYRQNEGTSALGKLIAAYCQEHAIEPRIAAGVKDRLAHIYRQLLALKPTRYHGLLVVIDEFEGWEKSHPSPHARAHDEDVLETLAYLLPRDLGYQVYTVVASQSAPPAKLQGGAAGDRFINIPLLASANERDYDVIVSRRVRGLNLDRLPEIDDHYLYCQQHFDFARNLTEAEFRDIFPFQPRCFEIVRRITARDLPTARSGITIFHEVVTDTRLLQADRLIRVTDLLRSRHLVEDCLPTPEYRDAYAAYKLASEALTTLDLDNSDLPLAQAALDTLFLWYLAYKEQPRPLSLQDLAQATLATDDFLRAEDSIGYVLGQMRSLRQIRFEGQQASFIPAGDEQAPVTALFGEYRRRTVADPYQISSAWTESLFFDVQTTRGQAGLFNNFTPDEPEGRALEHHSLVYNGQVIVASRWRYDWGLSLPKDDLHFRLVVLSSEAAESVKADELQDSRILVVIPASLSEEATRAAADWLAWQAMSRDYAEDKRSGREAEAVRDWLAGQRPTILSNLMQTHLRQYQNGRILTQGQLAISARDAFGLPGEDRRFAALVEPLLAAAYPQLPIEWERLRSTLRAAEMSRVFNGYFSRNPGAADTAAVRNYGVGLGLSDPDRPSHFAPQQAKVLDLIAAMLAERQGELPVWRLFETLSAPPYGLPYPLIQLYLLAFVRRGEPRAEITLKRDHKLRKADRQPFAGARLTISNVPEIEFKPGLERSFDMLVAASGPSWNDAVAFAREVDPDLHLSTDPSDVEAQAHRLGTALSQMAADISKVHSNLAVLSRTLASPLPTVAEDALSGLSALAATSQAGFETFFERATETCGSPDALRDQKRIFARLNDVAGMAAEIADVKAYLETARPRPEDRDLATDRLSLLGRFALDGLIAQPGLWSGLRTEFEQYRARYRNAYQKHHRDIHAERKRLQEALTEAPRRLSALGLLNGIEELGGALGEHLTARYEDLAAQIQPCSQPFASLTLEAAPACHHCHLTLLDQAPVAEVSAFQRELDRALTDQARRLASEAIRKVLARSDDDKMVKFLKIVQTSNLAALVDVMDDRLAGFIQTVLAEDDAVAIKADIWRRFAQEYPTLDEAQLASAVRSFERLLQDAFAEARAANPEKKNVRLTLQ